MATQAEIHSRHGFNPLHMPATPQQLNERASQPDKTWVIGDIINQLIHHHDGILHNRTQMVNMEEHVCRLILKLREDLAKGISPELAKEVTDIIKNDPEFLPRLVDAIIKKYKEEMDASSKRLGELEKRVEKLEARL